ncbi:MAG: phospho-sugar mutase [Clostridia bacterium]|nr:phospho-sugar mutase [Clostridia bacterium]
MTDRELYEIWCKKATDDPDLVADLKEIENNDTEIKNRFFADIQFGTAGLRGILGAGSYYMNIYTVRWATQGLSEYLNENYENPAVAIGYDSRHKSREFSVEAARVLAANGIKTYIYPELVPTPMVSFAIRHLGCKAGIMVTASHNPAKYNGYKCYGWDGCQMTSEGADAVYNKMKGIDCFDGVKLCDFDEALVSGRIEWINNDVFVSYYENVMAQAINPGAIAESDLSIIYTPLNGAGNRPVREVLRLCGLKNIAVVAEQEKPDGDFPTTPFPNPEKPQCFEIAREMAKTIKPDLLMGTDPDSDRIGIEVNQNGEFVHMTGNEVGALLLNYIINARLANGTMPKDPVAVKTIVTTNIADAICKKYGVQLRQVLTGFKYIGEQILHLEQQGQTERYLLGFEESYGYLAGSYVRDKDAVVAAMLISEMAGYYKIKGRTLVDVMNELYNEFGYYYNAVTEIVKEGADGMAQLAGIMASLRDNAPSEIAGYKVLSVSDYKLSEKTDVATGEKTVIDLPKSDVLAYDLEGGNQVIARPSGTEPKLKAYYTSKGTDRENAVDIQKSLAEDFSKLL